MKPFQFAFHDRVSNTPPQLPIWELATSGAKLSREDKDRIFHQLQENSGKSYYRLGGWTFPFSEVMKTYLVNYQHYGWQEVKAFDKMCIRNSWYTNSGIIEILEKPEK